MIYELRENVSAKHWIVIGALSAGLAVICGAFAAHGLNVRLPEQYAGQTRVVAGETVPAARKYLDDFRTAAEYQMYHALGLIAVGLAAAGRGATGRGGKSFQAAGWSFLFGTILFSGSLYALVLTGFTRLGMITPIGGVLFIAGWASLAAGAAARSEGVVE